MCASSFQPSITRPLDHLAKHVYRAAVWSAVVGLVAVDSGGIAGFERGAHGQGIARQRHAPAEPIAQVRAGCSDNNVFSNLSSKQMMEITFSSMECLHQRLYRFFSLPL